MAIKRNFILSSGIGISSDNLYLVGSTASTSSSTGTLIVTGGAGIGRSVNIGGRVGIGTNLLNAALNVQIPTTTTSALIIRGNTSQTSDAITYFSASGATQFAADANGRLRLTGMDGIWSNKVQQNIFDVSDGRVNWNLTTWQFSSIYWVTAGSTIGQASNQLQISNNGTTSITGVGVLANGWSTGGGNRAFGIVSPSGSERTYFNGYGNLVINPNNPNPLHDAWNQMHLLSMDISGTANTYVGNIILGRVESVERFSVGPFGNTRITVGSATTATGLLVKAVASQSGNIIETQASTGVTNFYISPTGGASFSDNIEIKSAKELRLNNSGNTFYTGLKAGANASNTTYTLPIAFPGTGTSVLQSDTSGTLSWVGSVGLATTATYAITAGTATTAQNVHLVSNSTSDQQHRLVTARYSGSGIALSGSDIFTVIPSESTLYVSGTVDAELVTALEFNVYSGIASTSPTSGDLRVTGGAGIGGSVSIGGRLQMFNGANYTSFVSSASGNTVYTLPATSPATGSSVLQSTSAGVMSWVPMTSGSSTPAGTSDGVVQFKSSSSLGGTLSLFFDPLLLGLRVSGFPGGETPTSTSAALKLESTVGSFNGSVNGTYYAANAPTGFAGDLMNLQINSVSKFRIDNTGAIIQNIGTNATSTTSGSVQVRGGLGITGALFTGESINSTATTNSTNTTSGSLIVSGGAGIAGTINVGGTAKIFSSTASTNTWTGALLVGGGVGISGQLTFTQASLGFTGITTNPSMSFIGATTSSPITMTVLNDNSLNWEGSQGSVFSIDSNLSTGEIFSVSDISGLPIISASAGQTVNINEFGGFTQIGNGSLNSSSTTTGSLVIAGGLGMTGNANIGGTVRISSTTQSINTGSGALTVSGGAGIAQSLFVGGNIVISNNIYSGGNNFTKAGQAPGDIIFDNNSNDTAGLLYYYKNNTNFGLDVYAVGSGTTRFRIVKDLNESGGSELWSIDRNGVVARTGWDVGEVIATRAYNNTDLNMQSTNTIGITSYVTIATITYTPKSSSSYLWIEFDAHYDFNGGTTVDDFFSRITVGGSTIMEKNQIFLNAPGGGTRSGVLFPISGRYTNTSTSGIAITVQARRGTADDDLRVFGSSTSGYMRIQEIGR